METQEHILEKCQGLHKDDTTKVTTREIFDEDIKTLTTITHKIKEIMTKLDQV